MSKAPRNMINLNDDTGNDDMSLIAQEAKVLLNKRETQKQIDNIIKGFKKETITRKERPLIAPVFRKVKKLDIESEIAKITASAEVRLTRNGKELTDNYREYLGKANSIFDDIKNASSRMEVDELKKTVKEYKKIVSSTKNLSRQEKREIKKVIKETEYAVKAVKSQKLSRARILTQSIKDNLPDIAGLTAAVFGNNPAAAWVGGVAGDYLRNKKAIKQQEREKRLALIKDERDKSISKSIDLRRDRDDEIIRRKNNLFSKKQAPEIEDNTDYEDQSSSMDYTDWSSDMGSFLSDLSITLTDSVREGIIQGMADYSGEVTTDLSKFEKESKDKIKSDKKAKTDEKIVAATSQTATGTQSIVKDIAETKEITQDSNEVIKDTNRLAEAREKIEKVKNLYSVFSKGMSWLSKYQDQAVDWIQKQVETGKLSQKTGEKAAKYTGKLFSFFRDESNKWQKDLVNLAEDQKDIQLSILRLLGGSWVERDQRSKERGLVVQTKLQDRVREESPRPPFGGNDDEFLNTLHNISEDFKQQRQQTIESSFDDEEVAKEQIDRDERMIAPLEGIYELMLTQTPTGQKNDSKGKDGIKNTIKEQAKNLFGISGGVVDTLMNKVSGIAGISELNDFETVNISDASIKALARAIGGGSGGLFDDIIDIDRPSRKGSKGARRTGGPLQLPAPEGRPGLPAPKPKGKIGKVFGGIKNALSIRKMDIVGLGADVAAATLAKDMIGEENDAGGLISKGIGLATDIGVSMGLPALFSKMGGWAGMMSKVPAITESISGLGASLTAAGTGVGGTSLAVTGGGVALAGAAGYGIGTIINSGIDAAVKSLSGGKNSSLGEWIYDITHESQLKAISDSPAMRAQRNKDMSKMNTDIKDMKETTSAKLIANSVNSAVTNVGGNTTNITMPVSAYDNDQGTNLLTNNLAA